VPLDVHVRSRVVCANCERLSGPWLTERTAKLCVGCGATVHAGDRYWDHSVIVGERIDWRLVCVECPDDV
jgi:hypothetical protein